MRALRGIWGMALLFFLVMGGIYRGIFTPTEAGGIGAAGAFLIALGRRTIDLRSLFQILIETGRTTAMMFLVLIGAIMFSNFINVARLPNVIADWLRAMEVAPFTVVLAIIAVYLVLGCILESFSMVLLTVPIFYPIVQALGFDLIWFGIIVVVATEIGLITPPIGLNVFVVHSTIPDVPVTRIFSGIWSFVVADIVRLGLLLAVPSLVLFLPNLMG